MIVSLITPTGNRPEAFALCERWIKNQTYKGPWEWLVVDDYQKNPTKLTFGQVKVPAYKQWTPQINTQRYNMDSLLTAALGDIILVIEDDEYYAPNYIEEMLKLLQTADIVGLSNSKYYHIKAGAFKYMNNFKHASLCHTAITKKAIPLLKKAVNSGHFYFDIELWKYADEEKLKSCLISNTNLSIGIKGMPGRAGLGVGHQVIGYHADTDLTIFKEWLGEDWIHYKPYLK